MPSKICSKCGIEKPFDNFYKRKDSKDGYRNDCKDCKNIMFKNLYKSNKDKINEKHKEYNKNNKKEIKKYHEEYYQENKEKISKKIKEYCENNKEKRKEFHKKYYQENKEKRLEYEKKRRKSNPLHKLKGNIRSLIGISIKNFGFTKKSHTYEIIGIDYQNCLNYLFENAKLRYPDFQPEDFLESNMYHIDHIIPLVTAKTEEEILKLNNYKNLQLLKAEDNLSKHDKLNWEQQ